MTAAGSLKRRVVFQREDPASPTGDDGGGGTLVQWTTVFTVWGALRPEPGSEAIQGGRLDSRVGAALRVRSTAASRAVTAAGWRVSIDAVLWQVRSITNPDQKNRELLMVLERGVGL